MAVLLSGGRGDRRRLGGRVDSKTTARFRGLRLYLCFLAVVGMGQNLVAYSEGVLFSLSVSWGLISWVPFLSFFAVHTSISTASLRVLPFPLSLFYRGNAPFVSSPVLAQVSSSRQCQSLCAGEAFSAVRTRCHTRSCILRRGRGGRYSGLGGVFGRFHRRLRRGDGVPLRCGLMRIEVR